MKNESDSTEFTGDTPAYSDTTDTAYPTWDALVEVEAAGYVVTAIVHNRSQSWPWTEGPFATGAEARQHLRRMRSKWSKDRQVNGSGRWATFHARPMWLPPAEAKAAAEKYRAERGASADG